jgi:hypothetical protein
MAESDFNIPTGLSRSGRRAALAIVKKVQALFGPDSSGGGCTAFYTPKAWKERGEEYGLTAELIVVYDGGDLHHFFGSYAEPEWQDAMVDVLNELGLWHEPCTGWYCAIYK